MLPCKAPAMRHAKHGDLDKQIHINLVGIAYETMYKPYAAQRPVLCEERGKRPYHFPVATTVTINAKALVDLTHRRIPKCDHIKTAIPQNKLLFSDLIDKLPKISHDVEPSTHQFMITDWMQTTAEYAFSKERL